MMYEPPPVVLPSAARPMPQGVRPDRRIVAWLFVIVLVAAFVGCLALPFLYPLHFEALYSACAGALLTGAAGLAAVERARLLAIRVTVDERGLVVRLRGAVRAVRWEEMGRLRVRSILQRLDVEDRTNAAPLRLPFALTGYDALASLIVARTHAQARADVSGVQLFRARLGDTITPVVAPLLLLLSLRLYGTVVIIAWVLSITAVLYWLTGWLRIRVEGDALVFVRPTGERRVPFSDIGHVTLSALDPRRTTRPTLLILHESGRVSQVTGVREGETALYGALSAALQTYRSAWPSTETMAVDA